MNESHKPAYQILVVDDDQLVRQTLHDVLSDQGFSPFCVSNGAAALHACATQPFDLALLDFALTPAMNGLDILKAMRLNHPAIKVIIITGYPHSAILAKAYQLNAHQCLVKPLTPDHLIQSIRRELNPPVPL